jgi:Uma2 family endonuclease
MPSVEKYLKRSYRPDRDHVDGDHAWAHGRLAMLLAKREPEGSVALTNLKLQIRPARYRVTDLCMFLTQPHQQIPTTPPFLCAEIVSPQDRFMRMVERTDDYLAMGVSYIWVVNPATKRAWTVTPADGWREVKSGVLRTENPTIEVPLTQIFAD